MRKKEIYIIDDIYALPDGERAELIDGKIYSREGKVRMCKFICIIRARPRGSNTPPLGADLLKRS